MNNNSLEVKEENVISTKNIQNHWPSSSHKQKIKISKDEALEATEFQILINNLSTFSAYKRTFSSDPSGQSCSPSHRHFEVMQYFSEHWNCLIGSHFAGVHFASSEPSPQSSSRSHTHLLWIHLPLLQVNSSERQVSSKIYFFVVDEKNKL